MANKNDLFDFDETTAANNDNVQGANIAENCAPSGINNAIRGLAAIVKRAVGSQGGAIASAATTPIGAAGTALYATITGTTTITSFGSVAAGTLRIVEFAGALTLTHNATSLKLPGSANITTAAGDIALVISLGSGNWKCLHYGKADGSPVSLGSGGSLTLTSTDAGASEGPDVITDRNSASPAVSDVLGGLVFRGRDSGANVTDYARIRATILDPTNGSEDGSVVLSTLIAGSETDVVKVGPGMQIGAPVGGDQGSGSINVDNGIYKDGVLISSGTIIRLGGATNSAYTTLGTQMPADNTIPQNTEGDEILTVTVSPRSASSNIRIRASLNVTHGTAGGQICAAIFVDSTANAIKAAAIGGTNSATMETLTFEHVVAAGSTSSRTYRVRAGSATTADVYLNGDSTARIFGGVAISTLEVDEILP